MSGADLLVRDADATYQRTSRWRSALLLAAGLLAAGLVLGTAPVPDGALDPRSTGPAGLRGALDVLRALDVEVVLATEDDPQATTVLVLAPLSPDGLAGLAQPGRRLVSTSPPPGVEATTAVGIDGLGAVQLPVACALLPDVAVLESAGWVGWDAPGVPDEQTCVDVGGGAWLVASEPAGGGRHVHVATLLPLVNARLADADTGLAAARLLAPGGRADRVLVLLPGAGDGAPPGLGALLDPRVVQAGWLLLGAAALFAAARGRRLGAPPDERLPVRVPGGEIVRALGDLRARASQRDATLAALRAHTRTELRRVHRLPADADTDELLAAHEAAGLQVPAGARAALDTTSLPDDDVLIAAARALTALRSSLGTAPVTPAATTPQTPIDAAARAAGPDDRTTP